jgi:hypothetical protein
LPSRARLEAFPSGRAELPRAELVLADHPLVPIHFMFNAVMRGVALAEQQANYLEAPFGRVLDAPLWKEFHCLTDLVFVL